MRSISLAIRVGAAVLASVVCALAHAQTAPVSLVLLGPRDNAYFIQASASIGTCTQTPTNARWVYIDPAKPNYASIRDTLLLAGVLQKTVVIYLDPAPCVLIQGAYYSRITGVDLML